MPPTINDCKLGMLGTVPVEIRNIIYEYIFSANDTVVFIVRKTPAGHIQFGNISGKSLRDLHSLCAACPPLSKEIRDAFFSSHIFEARLQTPGDECHILPSLQVSSGFAQYALPRIRTLILRCQETVSEHITDKINRVMSRATINGISGKFDAVFAPFQGALGLHIRLSFKRKGGWRVDWDGGVLNRREGERKIETLERKKPEVAAALAMIRGILSLNTRQKPPKLSEGLLGKFWEQCRSMGLIEQVEMPSTRGVY